MECRCFDVERDEYLRRRELRSRAVVRGDRAPAGESRAGAERGPSGAGAGRAARPVDAQRRARFEVVRVDDLDLRPPRTVASRAARAGMRVLGRLAATLRRGQRHLRGPLRRRFRRRLSRGRRPRGRAPRRRAWSGPGRARRPRRRRPAAPLRGGRRRRGPHARRHARGRARPDERQVAPQVLVELGPRPRSEREPAARHQARRPLATLLPPRRAGRVEGEVQLDRIGAEREAGDAVGEAGGAADRPDGERAGEHRRAAGLDRERLDRTSGAFDDDLPAQTRRMMPTCSSSRRRRVGRKGTSCAA